MRLITHTLTFAIGFVFACIIYQVAFAPVHQESADKLHASLKEAHDAAVSCSNKLTETRELATSCAASLKSAVDLGERCIVYLYTMPLDTIQKIRDSLDAIPKVPL